MESSGKPAHRSATQPLTAVAIVFLAASFSGCASPGPARPPSLHLPRVVTDLTAARTGDEVTLRWTTPEKTTDGLKVPSSLTAEICREAATHSAVCTPIKRIPVHPGPTETSDRLPGALSTGPAALLIYRVQILNAHGHSAGHSSPAFAAAGAAPLPIEHLQVTPMREGAMIEWQPEPASAVIDLDRTLVSVTAKKKHAMKQPHSLTPSTPTEVHLQAGKQAADRGGTIDSTAQRGETYRYTAQRLRSVVLDGHTLELRSVLSAPITVVMRDTFPPATPTGLAAVPGSGSIDLSWEPNTEPDLAGYIVYRQPIAADGTLTGTPVRLTPGPIPTPAFSDLTAQPGQTYSYRVVAIDNAGNQSPASAEARESRRNQ
jgi:hypothetical protein